MEQRVNQIKSGKLVHLYLNTQNRDMCSVHDACEVVRQWLLVHRMRTSLNATKKGTMDKERDNDYMLRVMWTEWWTLRMSLEALTDLPRLDHVLAEDGVHAKRFRPTGSTRFILYGASVQKRRMSSCAIHTGKAPRSPNVAYGTVCIVGYRSTDSDTDIYRWCCPLVFGGS